MAVTRLSDIIEPTVFFDYMTKDTTSKTALFESGILRPDAEVGARLSGGGRTFNVPFWKDLDNTESGVASDDPNLYATAGTITSAKDICRRQLRTRAWSTADLAGILAGSNPMQRIRQRVASYWTRQFQTMLVKSATGFFADNVSNDSSDMINDISSDVAGDPTTAQLVSAEAVIDACYTMGDSAEGLRTIVMHSTVMKRLAKLDLIDYVKDSEGKTQIPTYLGKRVVVDDGCRKVQGTTNTSRYAYWTYLFGEGAMAWAEAAVVTPVEVERRGMAGNGMGVETLITRRQFVMHPYGIKWTSSSESGEFPTNADLATTANWDRVYAERNQIAIAALVTNG
jgi:hypothetical protein